MPKKLYPAGDGDPRKRYIKTGAVRPPKDGEFYLSGAIPAAYRAPAGSEMSRGGAWIILREALPAETRCPCCGAPLPVATK